MPNISKRKTRLSRNALNRLDKVIYGLVAAIILIGLVLVWVFVTQKDTDDKAQVTANEQDNGSASKFNNDIAGAVVTAPEVTEKNHDSAEEGASGAAEEDKDTTNESQSGSATPWLLISILTLSTVANGCIAVFIFRQTRQSNKLHLERIKLLNDTKFVEPEALQETMRDLSEKTKALDKQLSELKHNNDRIVQSLGQQTSTALSKLEKDSQLHGEKVQDIMNAILEFNPKLDEKDKEIKRYKEGHDVKLVNKYILGYIKIRDQITKLTSSDQLVQKNLEQLIERLSMEIDHANVVEIEVLIGDKFLDDKYGGKLATPKLVPTDVTEKVGTIASVDLAGYEFTGNEKNMILRPAKVSVYELEQIK